MSRNAPREEHRALSFGLACAMHALIAALLYFGVQWQTRPAAPVQVELWAGALEASPDSKPQPKPQPVPKPEQPEPDQHVSPAKADIQLEKAKPVKKHPEPPKPLPKPAAPKKPEPKKPEPKLDLKALTQPPKHEVGKGQLPSDKAGKLARPPLDPSVTLAAINARQQAAEAANRVGATDAYYARVRSLVQHNMNYPDTDEGNPIAEFSVTLLPDMSVLSVDLKKSSGNAAFDEAVKRAILRISQYPPLPAGMDFNSNIRHHILKYRLHEK